MSDNHNRQDWAGAIGWRGGHVDEGDLLDQLEAEHEKIRLLLSALQGTPIGHPDRKTQMDDASPVIVRHGVIEQECLYPLLGRLPEETDAALTDTGRDNHARTEAALRLLDSLKPDDLAFTREFAVLQEHLTGHMSWEEARVFPLVRAAIPQPELDELGVKARQIRQHGRSTPQVPRSTQPPDDRYLQPEKNLRERLHARFTSGDSQNDGHSH